MQCGSHNFQGQATAELLFGPVTGPYDVWLSAGTPLFFSAATFDPSGSVSGFFIYNPSSPGVPLKIAVKDGDSLYGWANNAILSWAINERWR